MTTISATDPAAPSAPHRLEVRTVPIKDLLPALAAGYADLKAARTDALTMAVIYPISGVLLAGVFIVHGLVPFIFPICAGFALLGPLATVWFAAVSRKRERGEQDSEDAYTVPRLGTVQNLAFFIIGLFIVWNLVAALIYGVTLGSSDTAASAPFFTRVFTTQAGWELIVLGCGTGAIFALISLAVFFISFPLALDRPVTATQAVSLSIQATLANPLFVLVWGAMVVGGLILGAIPALLGIAIVLPVLGHTNWHIYRRMII